MIKKMLSKFYFSRRIILMPVIAGIAFVLIFLMVWIVSYYNNRLMAEIENGYSPSLELSRDLIEQSATIQKSLQAAVASSDEEMLSETDALRNTFLSRLDDAKKITTLKSREIEEISALFKRYYTIARETSLRMINKETGEALVAAIEKMSSE